MATSTTNYSLVKPATSELYDVTIVNSNSDIIDTTLFNKVDKVVGKQLSTEDYTTTEKSKLSGIASGAEVNQNAFTNIEVTGQPTVSSASKTGTFKLVQGSNVTLTTNNTTKEVTISATGTLSGSVNASDVIVTDSGNYFSGTQVESVLQEIGLTLSTLSSDASDVTFTPYGNIVATDVQNAIEELDDEKATYTVYTATIPSASWTGGSAPYSKAVTVTGLLSTDEPIVDLVLTGTYATDVTMRDNWSKIYRGVTSSNTITFYADSVPSADISIQLVVVR